MFSNLILVLALTAPNFCMKFAPDYDITWEINRATETATFEVEAKTTGYIGLGFSPSGSMTGADLVLGGFSNGSGYISDRHGIGNEFPPEDIKQHYRLIDARENETHTYIKFSRPLNSCDKQDLAITDSTMRVIWSIGQTDDFQYHGSSRGVISVNLMDGYPTPPDLSNFKNWTLQQQIKMPNDDTTYWCTFHKAPKLDNIPHHIVGFMAHLNDLNSTQHTHHVDIYRCVTPEGENPDELFGPHAATSGYDCYYSEEDFPVDHCALFEFSWSIGGMATVFPDHVGVPFGLVQDEYYMMEVHYDNPNEKNDVEFITGMELYYTEELREFDAGFLQVGQKVIYTHMIPPNSVDFLTPAHCHKDCTKWIPDGGINIFNLLLHAHLAGRQLKIRHFRDGKELPWIAYDFFYDFNYQQNRALQDEIKLLPGDEITLECIYTNTDFNGKPTIGGRSTREEMCMTFLLYYPLIEPVNQCGSFIPIDSMLNYLGIENITLGQGELDPTVTAPEHLAGKKYTEVIEGMDWNAEKRAEFQAMMKGEHEIYCFPKYGFEPFMRGQYPEFEKEYEPPNICALDTGGGGEFYMKNI